jgi:LysM repeat protein
MITAVLLTFFSFVGKVDSIRTEVINGKIFIIHRVEQKETLFGISRKYGVALLAIVENNPDASSSLEIGKLIKVPYAPNNRTKTNEGTIHRVGEKETLYSISKQYGVTVDELKSWNSLTSNGLKLGQELLIKTKVPEAAPSNTTTPASNSNTSTPNVQTNSPKPTVTTAPVSTAIINSESTAGSDEIRERGMVALLEGTEGNRKYMAYHRSVKTGTILHIKNNANQKEVFVRVVGKLPDTEANDVVLKVSRSAYDKLGGNDGKFPVEVIYFK